MHLQTQMQNRRCLRDFLLLLRAWPAALLIQNKQAADAGGPTSGTHRGRGNELRDVCKEGLSKDIPWIGSLSYSLTSGYRTSLLQAPQRELSPSALFLYRSLFL